MTRICLVCDVFYPSQESTSQLFTGLLRALAADGVRFDVVTNRLRYDVAHLASGPPPPADVRVHAVGLAMQSRASLPMRLARYAAFVVCASLRLLWLKTDRIWASTNPPFAPIWVAVLAFFRRKPFDVIVHDVYPDGLAAVGFLAERSLVARAWRRLNRWAYARASRVVVLGRDMADVLHDRYRIPRDKLVLFPNWSLFDQAAPPALDSSCLARELGLRERFVVQYSGNMGLWHDINAIVEAAASLADLPNVHFLMIGDGRRKAEAQQLAASRGIGNMTWLDFQPIASLPDSLACSSIALISQRHGLDGMAVPCKLYGILASGRAIVAAVPEESEVALVVRENACGIVVPPDDPLALAAAIRSLLLEPEERQRMAERAFAAYRDHYSLAAARSRYWQVWNRCHGR